MLPKTRPQISSASQLFLLSESNRLFILDVSRDAFLFRGNSLKVVDLESLFPLTGTVQELLDARSKRTGLRLDTYQKQFDYIAGGIKS